MTLMSFAYPAIPMKVHNAMIEVLVAAMAEERHRSRCMVVTTKPCNECRNLRSDASHQVDRLYDAIAETMTVKNEGPQPATATAPTQEVSDDAGR